MDPLNVYWWKVARAHGNFGDVLGAALCEHLSGRPIRQSPLAQADIVAIGSILEPRFWPGDLKQVFTGAIWGAGRMFGVAPFSLPQANICAVRGELTRATLQDSVRSTCALGDPGLLAPLLPTSVDRPPVNYDIGVIPHLSEVRHPAFRLLNRLSSQLVVIDPCQPLQTAIEQIRMCRFILSSAMHGLIVADSFGIPALWLRLRTGKENVNGLPEFKYRDYFSVAHDFPRQDVSVTPDETMKSLMQKFDRVDPFPEDQLRGIQNRLVEAFPF